MFLPTPPESAATARLYQSSLPRANRSSSPAPWRSSSCVA